MKEKRPLDIPQIRSLDLRVARPVKPKEEVVFEPKTIVRGYN